MNNISISSLHTFLNNGITHVFYKRNNVFSTNTYTYKRPHIKIAKLIIQKQFDLYAFDEYINIMVITDIY